MNQELIWRSSGGIDRPTLVGGAESQQDGQFDARCGNYCS